MKTHMQRWLARVALSLVAIAAWGTGATAQSLSGVYGGENCPYRLTFRGKDVVYIQFLAGGKVMQELPGQYKVDGDKIAVTAPSWGAVFTQKGTALGTPYLGGTAVCTKVSERGAPQMDPLVGKWTGVASTSGDGTITSYETIEFLSDGTLLSHLALSGRGIAPQHIIATSGKWTRLEDGRVKMELNGQAELFSVSRDVATVALIYENGSISTHQSILRRGGPPPFANTKDEAYVERMKSDLRNLATYEEQYAVDNNGAYFSGTATMASPLKNFTPSQNVTITVVLVAGPRKSWSATAVHSQSAKTCNNITGVIVCT